MVASKGRGRRAAMDTCDKCGKQVPIGGWAFCASPTNPEGHARGTYRFRMRSSMKGAGWTRSKR